MARNEMHFPTAQEKQVQYAVAEICNVDDRDARSMCFTRLNMIQAKLAEGVSAKDIAVEIYFRSIVQATPGEEARIRNMVSSQDGDFYKNISKLHFLDYEHLMSRTYRRAVGMKGSEVVYEYKTADWADYSEGWEKYDV